MNNAIDTFLKGIAETQLYMAEVRSIPAIWRLDNRTWLIEDGVLKRTVRFTQGQQVKFEAGHIVDCKELSDANMEIVGCYGTMYNTNFSIKLRDLVTNEETTLYL